MGTRLQKKLAKAIVDDLKNDHPATGQELLEKVGYSRHLAKQSGRVLYAAGVTEEVMALGFTVEEADKTVANVLKTAKNDANKLGAADRIYKRYGANAPEKTENVNFNVNSNPAEIDKFKSLREKYEQELLKEIERK